MKKQFFNVLSVLDSDLPLLVSSATAIKVHSKLNGAARICIDCYLRVFKLYEGRMRLDFNILFFGSRIRIVDDLFYQLISPYLYILVVLSVLHLKTNYNFRRVYSWKVEWNNKAKRSFFELFLMLIMGVSWRIKPGNLFCLFFMFILSCIGSIGILSLV